MSASEGGRVCEREPCSAVVVCGNACVMSGLRLRLLGYQGLPNVWRELVIVIRED